MNPNGHRYAVLVGRLQKTNVWKTFFKRVRFQSNGIKKLKAVLESALYQSHLVKENSAIIFGVRFGQHVHSEKRHFGVFAVAGAFRSSMVPGLDDADKVVQGLDFDGHEPGPAGRRHDGREDGALAGRVRGDLIQIFLRM